MERQPLAHATFDGPLRWLQQQLFVAPDTAKGMKAVALAREAIRERGGRWALSWDPMALGIVTWRPHPQGSENRRHECCPTDVRPSPPLHRPAASSCFTSWCISGLAGSSSASRRA